MAQALAERFMQALHQSEQTGEIDSLVALFSDDAELDNAMRTERQYGRQGVREFWRTYLSAFQHICSQFTHVTEGDHTVVLEWTAEGILSNGRPLTYRGISVVEHENDRVCRFRTYYDSAVFLPQGAKS